MGEKFDISYVFTFFPKLAGTLQTTLIIVGGALLTSLIVGFLVALPRLYKVPVLQRLSQLYASFFRGTPILIQLFLFYYGLPEILKLVNIDVSRAPVLLFVILTYGLHTGAYVSETIRSAVASVDRGQVEAAYSVGMSGYQAFTRIVMPQALAIAVPVLSNVILALLKDTSLAFSLGVMEMTGKSQTLATLTNHFVESYISLALIYLVISMALERLLIILERRLLRHESRAADSFPVFRRERFRRIRHWFTRERSVRLREEAQ